ncbi:DNA cytosine methyltransferase [Herminiimonas contaminans]|uniref:DNA (cytosine-5-)-methyltransferase n=1 Tax=Herminiimonas contaminans TaxID=1111140 RepID=A0ABS0ESL8_9BURK|nr:DNA cytosine methyltransferase [Herminiimonas contaminans]MBF8177841.1 DNA cytosine methyltransferase [Herminiimonas contaminans]
MKRDNFTLPLGLPDEMIVDNFAGGGGASKAILMALGREPDIAINHDGEALCMHAANHPTTRHYQEDVFLVHPGFVTNQQPIGLAWFSPTCTHFSRAKGDNILNQKLRGLAWVTLKWAAFQAPRCIFLENVEEFQGWCPLDAKGKPIKNLKGRTFNAFVKALSTGLDKEHPDLAEIHETLGGDFPIDRLYRGLGYKVEWKVIRACDFGAPTIRKRLFMIMRRDGLPIVWPEPTHGDPESLAVKNGKLLPWKTAADCIDWSIKCPSILFDRKRPLKPKTLQRIGRGFERYVKDAESPFIAPVSIDGVLRADHITKFNTGSIGHDMRVPMATATSGGGAARPAGAPHGLGVVSASLVQYYSGGSQNRSMDDPMPPAVTHDRIAVTCAHLVGIDNQSAGTGAAWSASKPINTIVTENRHALVTSHCVKLRNHQFGQSMLEPVGTLTAGGGHVGEVRTTLSASSNTEARRQAVREFLWEYCPSLAGVERPELVMINGVWMEVVDIGLRMLIPRELANAQGFPPDYILDPEYTYTDKKGKAKTKRLPGYAQVRMIGNSVSPPPARALIEANFKHEQQIARVA